MAAWCMACSDGNDDGGSKEIELSGETKQEQSLYADENGENNGIRFTAVADWTATVTEETVARSEAAPEVEWLTLSSYGGGPGEHTLQMTIRDNLTGKTRRAKITIRCGATEIVVTVEQKAAREDGTELKPVRKITSTHQLNSDKVYGSPDYSESYVRTFAYDEQGRVARIETRYKEYDQNWTVTLEFDYRVVGEIGIVRTDTKYGENEREYYRTKLDERGRAMALQEQDGGTFKDYIRFGYTEEGRLARIEDEEGSDEFFYREGLLVKYEYRSAYDSQETDVVELPEGTYYPNRVPNDGPFDVWGLVTEDDDYDFLFYLGRLGRMGDCLPETSPDYDDDDVAGEAWGYPEPNQTIHEKRTYVEWPEGNESTIAYRFDADRNPVEITQTFPFTVMETEYDIVVGSELLYPDEPWRGYRYEVKNRTTRKVREDKDTYTYAIAY